jgi:hypothetical protein
MMSEAKSTLEGYCAEIDGEIVHGSFHQNRDDTIGWTCECLKNHPRLEQGVDIRIVNVSAAVEAVG